MNEQTTQPDPWTMQPGETDNAFEAFCVYRDLGPQRSVNKAAQNLSRARQTLNEWAAKNNWVQRALAWDAEQDRLLREACVERQVEIARELGDKILLKVINMEWNDIPDRELPRYVEVWAKLARLLAGQPTENTKQEVNAHVDAGSDAELRFQRFMDALLGGAPCPADKRTVPPATGNTSEDSGGVS